MATALWLVRPSLGPWPLMVGLAPWGFRWWTFGRPTVGTAFDAPMVVYLLTAVVSVWAAYDRETAASKLWLLVGAALMFYVFANWQVYGGRQAYRHQAWLLSGLGALTAGYFLVSNDWSALPSKIPAITKIGLALQAPLPVWPFERFHPNVFGGVLAMLAPFGGAAANMAWSEERSAPKVAAVVLLGLTLIGLLFTVTRGAWLAMAVACALAAWWPLSGLIVRRSRRRRNLFFGAPAVLAIVLLLALILWPSAIESLLESLPASDSGGQRAVLYANALNLLSDYPLIGAGFGGFLMLYSSYALLAHVGFIAHSHNLYFNVVIEQGLLALVALAWMWLLMFEALWRSLSVRRRGRTRRRSINSTGEGGQAEREAGSGERKRLRYWQVMLGAGTMSLVVLLVQGLIDDPIYSSRAVVIFFLPLSFGVPILRVAAKPSRQTQIRTVAVAAALVLVVVIVWWRPLLSRLNSNLAAVEQSRQELSVYDWPEWPVQDAVRREVDLSRAIAGYERALALDDGNTSANRRLGQIELSLGMYEKALGHLLRAYTAAPWDNATRQLLGEAYIATGDLATGEELWDSVDNSLSQLDIRRYWYENLGLEPELEYMRQSGGS